MKNLTKIALFALVAGCAGEITDIDRTSPTVLNKDFFVGEWYTSATIVEAPYTTGFAFVGGTPNSTYARNRLERVRWDITERNLIAYRSYDLVEGTDQNNTREGADWRGPQLVAFPISRHFNVERGYNPATGEQNNVISENGSDCQWYNCEQFRASLGIRINGRADNGAHLIHGADELDPEDALRIDEENGLIEMTSKVFMKPEVDEELTRYYGFPIPKCWLYSSPYWDCRGQTVRLRVVFSRIPHTGDVRDEDGNLVKVGEPIEDDFEPTHFDDHRLQRFGYFRTTRFHRDPHYGAREANREHFANVFPIWQKVRDENGETIPMAEREPRPIVYYLNKQFPRQGAPVNLVPDAQIVADEWNAVLKEAVAAAQGVSVDETPDMFVLCTNNPVQEGDNALCGEPGTEVRMGDHRYNKIVWVPVPQENAPGGYGPSNADPLTGRVVSADAYIYGAGYQTYAAYIIDLMRVLNGDLDQESFIDGSDLKIQLEAAKARYATQRSALSVEELTRSARAMERSGVADRIGEHAHDGRLEQQPFQDLVRPIVNANLHQRLNTPELLATASGGVLSGDEPAEVLERHNALNVARMMADRYEEKLKRGGEQSICFGLFEDSSMLQIARRLARKPELQTDGVVDYDKVRTHVLRLIFRATTLHEVGHNLGLRHNFAASTDAMNYHDGYWDLKAELGILDPEFVLGTDARLALASESDEQGVSVREYQYSSIMDYGARWWSDLQGLGKYDRAAILYGYANKVEVFDYEGAEQLRDINVREAWMPNNYHYTTYPRILGGLPIDTPNLRGTVGGRPVTELVGLMRQRRLADLGEGDELADETLNNLRVPYRFCSDEYAGGSSYCHRFDEGADVFETVAGRIDKAEGYRPLAAAKRGKVGWHPGWSYMGYAISNFDFLSLQYKHFVNEEFIVRRGWDCIDPWTGQPLLRRDDDNNPIEGEEIAHFIAQQCGLEQYYAALTAVEHFVKVLQQPDEGTYCLDPADNVYRRVEDHLVASTAHCAEDSIDLDGREDDAVGHLTKWDPEETGYYAFIKPIYAGHWMDKWGALSFLTDTSSNFIGVDASSDTRSFQINFFNLFSSQLHPIIAGMVMGDASLYGPAWRMPEQDGEEVIPGEYERRVSFLSNSPGFDEEKYRLIEPNDRFFIRYLALITGAAWAVQQANEYDLNQNFKIGITGSIDDQEVPDAVRNDPDRYIELMDPVNLRTYFAVRTEDFGWQPRQDDDPAFVALGYDFLKRISDRYYDNGELKAEVMDRFRAEAQAQDGDLNGAALDAAALQLANGAVHKEFFWADLIRSIVDAYEMY